MVEKLNKQITGDICAKCGRCCQKCASNYGYFKVDRNIYYKNVSMFCNTPKVSAAIREFESLAKKYGFNKKTGFLRKDGCTLPWKKRSIMCLTYFCAQEFPNVGTDDVFDQLLNEVFKLRKKRKFLI